MPRIAHIGQAELEILNYIHEHHPVTVREVADHIAATKGHVRTTVLNVMRRLCQKGFLIRRKSAGVYKYSPRIPKPQLMRNLLRNFIDHALGGSLSPFVAYLARDARLTEDDLAQLRRLVQELDSRPKEDRP